MISIGLAHIPNTTSLEKNCDGIISLLDRFNHNSADLVLFPECSPSGFGAKMKDCTYNVLKPHLKRIESWVQKTGITVVLQTAAVE